jgi:hypothetical protein
MNGVFMHRWHRTIHSIAPFGNGSDGPQCWFVRLSEVRLLTAEGNYVRLSWGNKQPLLGRALASLEQRLDPRRFFRASRRQIINLYFIAGVEIGVGGRLHVQLRDGPEVRDLASPGAAFQAAHERLAERQKTQCPPHRPVRPARAIRSEAFRTFQQH